MAASRAGRAVGRALPALLAIACVGAAAAQDRGPAPYATNEGGTSRPPVKPAARRTAVQQLLDEGGVVADVALAVAAFPQAPPASGASRVLVAIEVGRRQILPDSLAIGVRLVDARGEAVFNGANEATVAPATSDVASPLLYTIEVSAPPGRYSIRVAVVDSAGRQASVVHPVVVESAGSADPMRTGSLAIGAAPMGGALRPLARSDVVRSGAVAWLETAGATPAGRLEVLDAAGGVLADARLTIDAAGPGGSRVAHAALPVVLLPPGPYEARASIAGRGGSETIRTRPFTLGRLPAPESSAVGELVSAAVGPFAVADVLDAAVLAPVLERALAADPSAADEAMRAAIATIRARGLNGVNQKPFSKRQDLAALMLRGADLLNKGTLEEAASAFRAALRASSEFLPAIVYLGACYAAGGRDREAVGAWQTALVTEADSPLVFRLAADGLVRLGDAAQALSLLAEAADRWPGDTSLVRRHALAVASREGPAKASNALVHALEQAAAPDPDLLALAGRLAVLSAARGDDAAPELVAKVKALADKRGAVPPLLSRWAEHFRTRDAERGVRN